MSKTKTTRDRAWRRRQRAKAIARAFRRWARTEPSCRPSAATIIASITAPTGSCQNPFCCGNPRRLAGHGPIQERRLLAESID